MASLQPHPLHFCSQGLPTMALNKRALMGLALMALCIAAVSAEKLKFTILVSGCNWGASAQP